MTTRSNGRRKILIVEDHDDTRAVYGEHFERVGYEVETAADGNEGIARALKMQPDVIVLDLAMPRFDGWDTMRLVRIYPSTATVPIIAFTAVGDEDALRRAAEEGCNAIVRKPCLPEDIERVVDALLGSAA